jgi:cell division protein FtsI/penicillin-binding protein 2
MGFRALNIREWLLSFVGVACLGLLALRAGQVQIVQHKTLCRRAQLQQTDTLSISALRGSLQDRFGTILSQSLENASLWADPQEVNDPLGIDRDLAGLGWTKPGEVLQNIREAGDRRFVWLHRDWTAPATVTRLEKAWPGVHVRPEPKRLYTMGSVLGPLLGRVGTDGTGLSGMEKELDTLVRGRCGRELRFVTGGLRPRTSLPPRVLERPNPGQDVRLTVDLRAQEITVRRLEEGVYKWNARAAFALVLDPITGEILAAASVPNPDPGRRRKGEGSPWRLRPLTDQWEPGSTLKPLTFCAALESGFLSWDEVIDCEDGLWRTPDWRISDHEPYGLLTTRDVLVHSSNIGTAKIALRAGPEAFYRLARHLGLGSPTGIRYPYEAQGLVRAPEKWNRRSLPTMGFGQELSVSALQLALLYAAIANGGNLVQPVLVLEVRDAGGDVVEKISPRVVRRALSEETCRAIVPVLREVVVSGTGTEAEIPWFPPAGKTGTAQVHDPETGGYSSTDYMASFVGFAPWYEPRYLCIVVLDSPQGSIYGGRTAAPIFRAILEDLTASHGVFADAAVASPGPRERPETVPDVRGLSPNEARAVVKASGFVPVLEGRGVRVREMDPPPGSLGNPGTVVRLLPGGRAGGEGEETMPDLRGWPLRKAVVLLSRRGVSWSVSGDGWVTHQSPQPGRPLARGTQCALTATHKASRAWRSWLTAWEGMSHAAAWGDVAEGP